MPRFLQKTDLILQTWLFGIIEIDGFIRRHGVKVASLNIIHPESGQRTLKIPPQRILQQNFTRKELYSANNEIHSDISQLNLTGTSDNSKILNLKSDGNKKTSTFEFKAAKIHG